MEKSKNEEALELASEILKNIELNELKFSGVVTKAMRLARLRGDLDSLEWLGFEFSGYPSTPDGIPYREFIIGKKSGRHFETKDNGVITVLMFTDSVGKLESDIETAKDQLTVTKDPNISVSSANPYQHIYPPGGNFLERSGLRNSIATAISRLEKIKASVYNYVLNVYYELRFLNLTESVFEKTRKKVDSLLAELCPKAIRELVSAYQNIQSNSSSDLANAGNSCRRAIKEVSDILYPAKNPPEVIDKHVLSDELYLNRLIQYIKNQSNSESFKKIVGSQLSFIIDRLEALYGNSSKGTHANITKEEAERLVIYVYLLMGDILTLVPIKNVEKIVNKTNDNVTTKPTTTTVAK